jgi:putative endonuclease
MIKQGAQAEQLAAQYLQQQGLTPVAQNYRSRFGEIDLIMQDDKTLVFIEVRLRQQRIISTAQHYLANLARMPPCRFDVVLLDDVQGRNMQWLKNAFDA